MGLGSAYHSLCSKGPDPSKPPPGYVHKPAPSLGSGKCGMCWFSAEDIAAACGVPVEWVPTDFAALSDEEIVDKIEARRDAEKTLRASRLGALLARR